MVLPLLAAVALRAGAGAAVRGVATKAATSAGTKAAINSTGGRIASQAVGSFGVNAIQRGVQNRQQPKRDHGITQQIRQNPGEALVAGAMMMTRSSTLSDHAMSETQNLLQSTQFGR